MISDFPDPRPSPFPGGGVGTAHPAVRGAELHVAPAFHADARNQGVAFPAGGEAGFVQFVVRLLPRRDHSDPIPDIRVGIVLRRFTEQTPPAFLHLTLFR